MLRLVGVGDAVFVGVVLGVAVLVSVAIVLAVVVFVVVTVTLEVAVLVLVPVAVEVAVLETDGVIVVFSPGNVASAPTVKRRMLYDGLSIVSDDARW